jgi:hypothetical protein
VFHGRRAGMAEMSHSAASKMNSRNDRDKGEGDGPEHLYPPWGTALRFVMRPHSYSFRCSGGTIGYFSDGPIVGVYADGR